MLGGGEQPGQLDERRDLHRAGHGKKLSTFPLGKTECALACFIVHCEQIVNFPDGARRSSLVAGAPALGASHQYSSPSIGGRVADGAEERFGGGRVKWTWPQLKGRFERESFGVSEPVLVVFKSGAFPVLARASPQTSHQVGRAFAVHVYQNFLVHYSYSVPLVFGLRAFRERGSRMRSGRFSS